MRHEPPSRSDHHAFRRMLADAGMRVTAPRVAILEALRRSHAPMAVDALGAQLPGIDRVTLYRNLTLLARRGIVYQTDFRTGKALYELQDTGGAHPHHHHLVCTGCAAIEKVAACIPHGAQLQVLRDSPGFASIESHSLEFFGTCRACDRGQ